MLLLLSISFSLFSYLMGRFYILQQSTHKATTQTTYGERRNGRDGNCVEVTSDLAPRGFYFLHHIIGNHSYVVIYVIHTSKHTVYSTRVPAYDTHFLYGQEVAGTYLLVPGTMM